MKHNYPINNFSDLEREEIRIKMRLKKQEELIKIKLKTLPEEIVTAGASKLITGVLSGNFLSTAISIIKTVGSAIGGNNSKSESGGGIMSLIKTLVKAKFSN
jgi:hypothetical protein